MKTLADWNPTSKFRALIFGKSKVGKTFGALSFPRPCVMSFDPEGAVTGMHPEFVKQYGIAKARGIIYEEFYEKSPKAKGGVRMSHNAFDDACRFFDEMMSPTNVDKFDTWIIDSATLLSEACQLKAIVLLGDKAFEGARSNTHAMAVKYGLVVPKQQDYGSERSMSEQFVDMVLETNKHVLLLCHEYETSNDAGVVTNIVPLLTGKSRESIPARFSEVYRLVAQGGEGNRKRTLITETNGIVMAGSRYGVPSGIEFTWDAISKALAEVRATQQAAPAAGGSK